MPECQCCVEKRTKTGLSPRTLIELQIKDFQAARKKFLHKEDPIFICEYCDGPAMELAEALILKRRK